MSTAYPTAIQCSTETEGRDHLVLEGEYYLVKGEIIVRGFNSFYEAYMYALNRFGSEGFLVQKNGW